MNEVFKELGISSFYDFKSTISESDFGNVNYSSVKSALKTYKMRYKHLTDDADSKFHHINRILMLKYGLIIAPSRTGNGYQLENVLGISQNY